MEQRTVQQVIEQHKESGRFFSVGDQEVFALDYGPKDGEVILCLHGVPTSSFLYRKVLASLAKKGYRGISIDWPGLGLSDRPEDFDYSFRGFVAFLEKAVAELQLKKFHLVVHDIGGPIGFAYAALNKEKIQSLSILNTWIDVANYTKPIVMQPFEKPVIGEGQLKLLNHSTWSLMFDSLAVKNSIMIPPEEVYAYVDLLKHKDDGAAFLKIMRSFDYSQEFRDLCFKAVQNVSYPVQAIWGAEDPALRITQYGKEIQKVAGLKEIKPLFSKHLLQEEVWEALSLQIDEFIKKVTSPTPTT